MTPTSDWLTARASLVSGSVSDGWMAYLRTKTGLSNDMSSMEYAMLGTLGFTQPSITDRQIAFWAAKTTLPVTAGYSALQQAFYANTANDYV